MIPCEYPDTRYLFRN